ncbi:MAG: diadenylate cyclase CdaA [Candidatus Acidiferrales bacterium]
MTMGAAAIYPIPFQRLDLRAAVDIFLIAVLIYYLLKLLKGTRGVQMLIAVLLLFLFYEGARWAQLEMVAWLLTTLLPYFAIALIVLFQPEIRRALSRLGRNLSLGRLVGQNAAPQYDDIVLAAGYFSQNRIGSLVVIERDVGLRTYIESGISLDANLSYDLLISIFRPGAPLHDGAVILQGDRVCAAACFLPLSLNSMISNQLGTRHRAAIGVTEESDAVALVVSEETGAISFASGGTIELNLTTDQLQERLTALTGRRRQTAFPPGVPIPAARK